MTQFRALLRVYLRSALITTLGTSRGKNKKSVSGVAALVILGFIMLLLSVTYSISFAFAFGPLGGLDLMLKLMQLMAVAFPTIFILFLVRGVIFSTKDLDLVLSLPVSSFWVMLARMAALYLESLFMVEVSLIPTAVVWLLFGGAGGAGFVALLLVEGLFLALVPCFIGVVLGGLMTLLTARLPFKNFFFILFSFAALAGIMFLSVGQGQMLENIGDQIGLLRGALDGIPPVVWAADAVIGPSVPAFLLTVALCLVPFLLFMWLFSKVYKRVLTLLSSHSVRSDYKLRRVGSSGAFAALLKKEARRFFGTPAYFFNAGIGMVMLVLALGVLLVNQGNVRGFLAQMANLEGGGILTGLMPAIVLGVLGFCLMVNYPAAVSFNLEGKYMWILKSAPLGTGRIFMAKAGFQCLYCGLPCLIAVPLAGFVVGLSPLQTVAVLLVALFYVVMLALTELLLNLRWPRLDADTEVIAIKQSTSALMALLFSFLEFLLLGALYVPCYLLGLPFEGFALVACLVQGGVSLLLVRALNTRGRVLFAEL